MTMVDIRGIRSGIPSIAAAIAFSFLVPAIGYASFGIWPAFLFFTGYVSGLTLWLFVPMRASFASIKAPYLLTFSLFLSHRIEEKVSGFFETLARITGVPTPEIDSPSIIALVVSSVLAWILAPFLMGKGVAFGNFLVWTFFASMGVTELAHFVLPLFLSGPYGYFPGMISVVLLAPTAWYGMWRMTQSGHDQGPPRRLRREPNS